MMVLQNTLNEQMNVRYHWSAAPCLQTDDGEAAPHL